MNKPEQKSDSTSTSENGAPAGTPAAEEQSVAKTQLAEFPCIVESETSEPIKFGTLPGLIFPTGSNGEIATIDPSLLRGRGTLRLLNIKQALKIAGKANDADNRKWFNVSVRDVWHKVLKFAARDALANGKPVSLGLSKRTSKKTGQVTLTSKHGFEHVIIPPTVKSVEDKAAAQAVKQSKNRAKRQKRNRPLTPVVAPENVARIDALKSELPAEKAA